MSWQKKQGELVAADTTGQNLLAWLFRQASTKFSQQRITNLVTIGIIDVTQSGNIKRRQGSRSRPAVLVNTMLQPAYEADAGIETGQRIVESYSAELLLGFLQRGDILFDGDIVGYVP